MLGLKNQQNHPRASQNKKALQTFGIAKVLTAIQPKDTLSRRNDIIVAVVDDTSHCQGNSRTEPTNISESPAEQKGIAVANKWRIVISTQGEKALAKGMGATVSVFPEVSHCRRENSSILHPSMSHFKFRRIEDRARYQGKDNSSQSMNPLSQPYRTEVFLALFEKFLTSSR
jgi:hypothetical protein